jgi:hypothetical protein
MQQGGRDRGEHAAGDRPGDHVERVVDADMHPENHSGRRVKGDADGRGRRPADVTRFG